VCVCLLCTRVDETKKKYIAFGNKFVSCSVLYVSGYWLDVVGFGGARKNGI
jgi:hypothetical protein